MHDGGGATYAQPEAAVARRRPQQRSDGGTTEAATRAGRWRDGGATVAASFSPAVRWRSKTGDPNFVDGGAIGDGEGDGEVADGGLGYVPPEAKSSVIGLGPLTPETKKCAVSGSFEIWGPQMGYRLRLGFGPAVTEAYKAS
ncbi:hypothetical protein DEO72_LG11g2764 [Vigna unguiculata]|uniref:Uncharacterized protein n=1 Tax=Vigna unguiculata TaxID=3917 RepID=A0A4D6NS01_VIGUN|nr:hypothetical protein DEO72_LG11g2764 [Vigna unguiculata]